MGQCHPKKSVLVDSQLQRFKLVLHYRWSISEIWYAIKTDAGADHKGTCGASFGQPLPGGESDGASFSEAVDGRSRSSSAQGAVPSPNEEVSTQSERNLALDLQQAISMTTMPVSEEMKNGDFMKISKEFSLFEATNKRPPHLQQLFDALSTVQATFVEAEGTFLYMRPMCQENLKPPKCRIYRRSLLLESTLPEEKERRTGWEINCKLKEILSLVTSSLQCNIAVEYDFISIQAIVFIFLWPCLLWCTVIHFLGHFL